MHKIIMMNTVLRPIHLAVAAASILMLALSFARASSQGARTPTSDWQAGSLRSQEGGTRREQLRAEHLRVLDQLNEKDTGGNHMDLDDPRVPGLVRKGWDLAGAWASEWLETHPEPSTRDLKQIFDGFAPEPRGVKSKYGDFLEYGDYYFQGSAVRVGPSVYVAEGSYGIDFPTGTFMVVARNSDGHFQALWNIKELAEKHYPQRDEIGRWMHLVRRAYYNGPLVVGKVIRASTAANGNPRFVVDAYQAADGGTQFAQLSIWEWDGAAANPLLVEVYYYAADFWGLRFDGETLRISTKEELEVLDSCGMCTLPRGIWTVRITPRGVRNLGHRFFQPEVQWTDKLLSKLTKQEDATDLANTRVLNALKAQMHERPEAQDGSTRPSAKMEFWFGMLEGVRVLRRGRHGSFVIVGDDAQLRFSYVRRKGRPYFTRVKISDGQ